MEVNRRTFRGPGALAGLLAAAFGALCWAEQPCAATPRSTPHAPPIRVLIDSIHAHNAVCLPHGDKAYDYHNSCGLSRAFGYLKARGVRVDEVTTGRITPARLAGHRMLFVNLVSADLPAFHVSEIAAIQRYVQGGGSLLVITDHSNCYYNAYKLSPLLEELGIRAMTETACEPTADSVGESTGWIAVTRFARHPVTSGLRAFVMGTGTTVDERYAIARTSGKGWGDRSTIPEYGEVASQGFYGNWKPDKGERTGSLGVLLAKQLGRGRIVILPDQNMVGNAFIHYADNYRVWLNTVAWLTHEPGLARPDPYRRWHAPRIAAYDDLTRAAFGSTKRAGYFGLFAALGRRLWFFATDDLSGQQDLIVFANDGYNLPEGVAAAAVAHLRAGRNIVVLGKAQRVPAKQRRVLDSLVAILGKPREDQVYGNKTYAWTGCGRVYMVPRTEPFVNATLPQPYAPPNEDQRVFLDALAHFLAGCAKHEPRR